MDAHFADSLASIIRERWTMLRILGLLIVVMLAMSVTGLAAEPRDVLRQGPQPDPSGGQLVRPEAQAATAPPPAPSEQETLLGDRFSFKVGYKLWLAYWSAPRVLTFTTTGIAAINSDFQSKGAFVFSGPTVTGTMRIRESDWLDSAFVSFTWLNGGFHFYPISGIDNSPPVTTTTQETDAIRRDYNITAGLAIWKGFGIFAGYYNNHERFSSQITATGVTGVPPQSFTRTIDGPIMGLFGNADLTERVSFYGNLAYAPLNVTTKGPCDLVNACVDSNAVQGYSGELGLNIDGPRVWKVGTELQIGYRYQIIRATIGPSEFEGLTNNKVVTNDITHGPIFTISARF